MTSTARSAKAVEAIDVAIEIDGRSVRAIVTKEALQQLCELPKLNAQSMLESFHSHRTSIEAAIVKRYAADGKEPVVVHDNG